MSSSFAGFELQGADGDETRLLSHVQLGYSIAVPGRARITRTKVDIPRYDILLALADAPVQLGFRMDEIPGSMQAPAVAASSVASYALTRSSDPDGISASTLKEVILPRGAGAASHATYRVRGDDDEAMEFLEVVAKTARGTTHALHMTVRFRRSEVIPLAWANLRAALLAHQSWLPGELPSTQIWPETSAFLSPSATFALTDEAAERGRAKAELIHELSAADVQELANVLLQSANIDAPPSALWGGDAELALARRIAGCVPSTVAEILMRDMPMIRTAHDLRGWLWECYWAVGNRAGLRKTN